MCQVWYPLLAPVYRSWAKHRRWYFKFPDISDQFLLKENCHNSRTSDDLDMKLGPVTKLEKTSKTTSDKFGQGRFQTYSL